MVGGEGRSSGQACLGGWRFQLVGRRRGMDQQLSERKWQWKFNYFLITLVRNCEPQPQNKPKENASTTVKCTNIVQYSCKIAVLILICWNPPPDMQFTIGQATLVTSDGCGAIVFVPLLLFTCLTCGTNAKCIKVWKTNISKYMSRVRALIHISSSNHGRLKKI